MDSSTSELDPPMLTASDRLRIYRKCFHLLDQQLEESQEKHSVLLQAELRCLEELVMLSTDLPHILKVSSGLKEDDDYDPSLPAVHGLNLSLVTDILMLSSISPWAVFVADRSLCQICYVSPSVKRMFGWKSSDLLSVPAWEGCHAEDITVLQHMLLMKDASSVANPLVFRRLKKDRTYVTVQATGRAVGTRWYAWVEQEVSNACARPNEALELPPRASKTKVVDAENVAPVRPRKNTRPTLEGDLTRNLTGAARPASPLAPPASPLALIPGLEKHSKTSKFKEKNLGETENHEAQGNNSVPVESSSSSSTSVNICSPAEEPNGTKAPAAGEGQERMYFLEEFDGKKVLLVEDDTINRTIAQKLLEGLKCQVTLACNGQEALEIFQSSPSAKQEDGKVIPPLFDLVLMDLMMPVMDGATAVHFIRDWEADQEPPRKRMVIFAATSSVCDRDMVKCLMGGFDAFLRKPLTVDKLLDGIEGMEH